jgi:hypothetical protein
MLRYINLIAIMILLPLWAWSDPDPPYGNRWHNFNPGNNRSGYRMEPERNVSIALVDSSALFVNRWHYFQLARWDDESIVRLNLPFNPDSSFTRNRDSTRISLGYENERMNWYLRDDSCFEWEIILHRRPEADSFSFAMECGRLLFFYQDTLTQQERDQGCRRPDSVVGSYAAYHPGKRGNDYATGKAFHIYRPKACDNSDTVWCELSIDNRSERLTVIVPRDFLERAQYPVTIDPTFGYSSIGGSSMWWGKKLYAHKVITSFEGEGMSIDSAAFYVPQITYGPYNWRGGLYTHDSTNNEPHDSVTSQYENTVVGAVGWIVSHGGFSDHVLSPNTTYWLAQHNNCANEGYFRVAYDNGPDISTFRSGTYDEKDFPAFPFNFGGADQETARIVSYYAWCSPRETASPRRRIILAGGN